MLVDIDEKNLIEIIKEIKALGYCELDKNLTEQIETTQEGDGRYRLLDIIHQSVIALGLNKETALATVCIYLANEFIKVGVQLNDIMDAVTLAYGCLDKEGSTPFN